jgi:hypothetical protein
MKETVEVTASCTWGEGPDVLMITQKKELPARYQKGDPAQKDYHELTAEQAIELGKALIDAGTSALLMDRSYAQYCLKQPETLRQPSSF